MRIIPIIVFLLFLLGCGGTYMREGEMHVLDLENERFSFLSSGETTKDEVLSQLGKPTTTFENETILVYRLIIFKEHRRGSMCWDSGEILALPDLRVLALDSQVREWDEDDWREYNTAGIEAYQRGDYVDAERLLSAALEEAEEFGVEDLRFATSLNNLALLYYTQGRYAEAEPLYQRALAIREMALVYGLILVFDKGNIVEEHRIFRPRINITDCGYEG